MTTRRRPNEVVGSAATKNSPFETKDAAYYSTHQRQGSCHFNDDDSTEKQRKKSVQSPTNFSRTIRRQQVGGQERKTWALIILGTVIISLAFTRETFLHRFLKNFSSCFLKAMNTETDKNQNININEYSSTLWMPGPPLEEYLPDHNTDFRANEGQEGGSELSLSSSSTRPYYIPSVDGPPADLVLRGKRDKYTPCPPQYRKRAFYHGDGQGDSNILRAFSTLGWTVDTSSEAAFVSGTHHILYLKHARRFGSQVGKAWQRYSRIPGFAELVDSKDGFVVGFRRFQHLKKKSGDTKNYLYFLPQTFRLGMARDVQAFQDLLQKGNGRDRPWVLKKTRQSRGRGVEILAPHSQALDTAVSRSLADRNNFYIVQAYVCNELTWFDGEKMDLRFYWFVASVDPLIVLYHDGFVRVGDSKYNQTDFASTSQHLTNSAQKSTRQQEDVLADALWRRIRQHYDANYERLAKHIVDNDPVRHVRNQIKEAISTTVAAFYDEVFSLKSAINVTTENLFSLYGADFIIDDDLDVYYVEAQVGPQMKDTHDFRIDLYRRMVRPMIQLVEEIAVKQSANAKANLLPLENLGEWEIVFAGKDQWRYEFPDYQRSTRKRGCNL